jgi:hypothetical protein
VTVEGSFLFDWAAWPLVVATCPTRVADESMESFIAVFTELHLRKERFALIFDTRPTQSLPSAKWRKAMADWANEPRVRLNTERYNVGWAIVFSSALARGACTALLWLWRPPSPQFAAATMEEAVDWCCQQLTRSDVPLGPWLEELRTRLLDQGAPGGSRQG